MGNLDHLRMQMPHRLPGSAQQQVSQVSQVVGASHLPHRVKGNTGTTTGNTAPYFHHFLDRTSSNNSSTNSLLFNPPSSFGDVSSVPSTTAGKRPRVSPNSSFLAPYSAVGFPSPPSAYDTDHPLPDFNANWGFNSRNVTRGTSSGSAPTSSNVVTTASHSSSSGSSNSTASLSAIGSGLASPTGTSMFTVDSLLPDYETGLYSLWSTTAASNVMGYEPENEATQNQQQVQQQPLYLNSEEELKMDYPQLTEFNQGDLDYLCEPMEGGPSPTTPLGTTGNGMMKMDHLVTTDRRVNTGAVVTTRESSLDRLLAPPTLDYGDKRERSVTGEDAASGRTTKRTRGVYSEAYPTASTSSSGSAAATTHMTSSTSSFRSLARNTQIETKRESMPSLGSLHSGTAATVSATASSGAASTTSTITTAVATSPKKKGSAKRPRSRQCDYPGCANRARSHQKCKKHGGAHQCVFEGCTKNSQSRGLCIAHGGGSRCKMDGCVRAAQSKGLCKSHGGGEYCAVEGCRKKAHLKHLCRTHGGGVRCKFAKCSKWAQRKGWCMAHAKEFVGTT